MKKIYLIKVDLGYIGYDFSVLYGSHSNHDAWGKASELAIEQFHSYLNLGPPDGVRSIDDIMDEDGVDPEEAQEIQNSELLDSFSIEVDEFNGVDPYAYDWIDITDSEMKSYLRDIKIETVLENGQTDTNK